MGEDVPCDDTIPSVSVPGPTCELPPGEPRWRSSVECDDAVRMPHCKDPSGESPHVVLTEVVALGGEWGATQTH